ncbi:cytochrome-c peroxidase [Piscinibacter terrae]|uniref:Cytochrome-c peroxidase n=1 Tax=Piscinibacter terrae TaxID=2496871 RepID=A0A3N7HMT4_9BURK|nr:cytochrome c peroxidase [Albitalea terrae]RQP23470.1 cytochrome-c peroxidase [Albitalea terrae]
MTLLRAPRRLLAAWAVAGGLASVVLAQPTNRPAYLPLAGGLKAQAELAEIGREMFFDAQLSASGRVSCTSCHDPAHGHAPANALPVQPGGSTVQGFRAAPSLRYLHALPPFTEHYYDNDGDASIDAGPTGGYTWDGRAASAHEQARLPLLSPHEMGNASPAQFTRRLSGRPYASRLAALFGFALADQPEAALDAAAMALEVFQQTPALFAPYTSKYDEVLRGRAQLNQQETRGLAVFNDPERGNCASCHLSERKPDGAFPLFTDFGHMALAAPRNAAIQANANPSFFDLGLCGPLRTDFSDKPAYCGSFRTPSLRNVTVRRSFFHNGVFHSLEDVMRFYAERDTHPERFYAKDAKGGVRVYDDLPPTYHANVNQAPPFGRQRGDTPAMTAQEMADVIAFLHTLTDADLLPPPLHARTGNAPIAP